MTSRFICAIVRSLFFKQIDEILQAGDMNGGCDENVNNDDKHGRKQEHNTLEQVTRQQIATSEHEPSPCKMSLFYGHGDFYLASSGPNVLALTTDLKP